MDKFKARTSKRGTVTISNEELRRIDSDKRYWNRVAKILGMTLSGWTYKDFACMYYVANGGTWVSYEIRNRVAEKLLEQDKEIRKLKKEINNG